MEINALNSNINERKSSYQGYQFQRRTIMSSPGNETNKLLSSPKFSPQNYNFKNQNIIENQNTIKQNYDYVPKNQIYQIYSPKQTEVNFPNGDSYTIREDQSVQHTENKYSPRLQNKTSLKSDDSDSDSDFDEVETKAEKRRRKRREEKENQKENQAMLRLLMEDMLERKSREEKEKSGNEKKSTNNQIPSGPGYKIPLSEPIQEKSKIPNYEEMSNIDKDRFKEKFRNNYNMLMIKYPRWKIELPDLVNLPLKIVHERYEQVVKTICVYQTAMKWKVYLIIMIAGLEYYVGHYKNYAFAKGLLKSQIKSIHKYDIYLIEFAEKFYGDGEGEEYSLWMRALGTFLSSTLSFSSINGLAKIFGEKTEVPDYIFEQADKFVSPPEGTAKLHSDGISDVPEPPEVGSFQDSNFIINGIGSFFSMFTDKHHKPNNNVSQNHPPQVAQVINENPKKVNDFDNVEF